MTSPSSRRVGVVQGSQLTATGPELSSGVGPALRPDEPAPPLHSYLELGALPAAVPTRGPGTERPGLRRHARSSRQDRLARAGPRYEMVHHSASVSSAAGAQARPKGRRSRKLARSRLVSTAVSPSRSAVSRKMATADW